MKIPGNKNVNSELLSHIRLLMVTQMSSANDKTWQKKTVQQTGSETDIRATKCQKTIDEAYQYCCTVMHCSCVCVWQPSLALAQPNMACWSSQPHGQMTEVAQMQAERQTTTSRVTQQSSAGEMNHPQWHWRKHPSHWTRYQAGRLLCFSHTNTGGHYARAHSRTLIRHTRQKG